MGNGLTGKQIRKVWFGKDGAEAIECNNETTLEILNEFHGEYDIDWIIVKTNGVEKTRINTKYVETIEWV
jgi:hypothetical protein